MVGYGIRCPRCDGHSSTIEETRGDPERRVPVIVRTRTCGECGEQLVTMEVLVGSGPSRVRLPDPRSVLATIRKSGFRPLTRRAMVSGSEMAGTHWAPGLGNQLE